MRTRAILEGDLLDALLLEAPKRLPTVRLFRRNVGLGRAGDRVVRFSIPGQADVYALVRGGGHIELELKTSVGSLSDAQRAWRSFCEEFSIPYLILKGADGETAQRSAARFCEEIAAYLSRTIGM